MISFIIPSFYGFGGSTYWGNITVLQNSIEYPHTDFPNYLGLFTVIPPLTDSDARFNDVVKLTPFPSQLFSLIAN